MALPPEVEIGPLRDDERARTTAVLARAFRDNPLNMAVIGAHDPQRRLRANLHGTRALLPVAQEHGQVWVARWQGQVVGALIGTPPLGYPLPPPAWRPRLRCLLGQGWHVARRWAEVFQVLDEFHPQEPHHYLGTLGVHPEHHGRGFGTALLRHWLGLADLGGEEVYLETDRGRNLSFYAREGFEVRQEARVLGAQVWCMARPARRP